MMIDQAEALKRQLTDKYVVVNEGVAELRRFVGLTGRVKTVNMNCRALVQFDGPVDISWYDIDPSFLKVVDAPQPKAKKEPAEAKPKAESAPKKPASGQSPLEMARKQGAAGAKPASGEGKKLSPLEMARQQGAAGAAKPEAKEKPAASASGAKLSPLEMARQQGAAKAEAEAAAAASESAPVEEAPVEQPAAEEKSAPAASSSRETPSSTEEIIALAKQQGPFKG
ncbi:hypothetical protein AB1L42_08500 [Thalassoglobus sp. JC818]|uniref:hypothetical protein n=1 Tax=Thalassoglobus sp. JC818 TaxID=3232136 RepID=UPI0034596999